MTNTSVCSVPTLLGYKLTENANAPVHQTLVHSDLFLHHHHLKALIADLGRQ